MVECFGRNHGPPDIVAPHGLVPLREKTALIIHTAGCSSGCRSAVRRFLCPSKGTAHLVPALALPDVATARRGPEGSRTNSGNPIGFRSNSDRTSSRDYLTTQYELNMTRTDSRPNGSSGGTEAIYQSASNPLTRSREIPNFWAIALRLSPCSRSARAFVRSSSSTLGRTSNAKIISARRSTSRPGSRS